MRAGPNTNTQTQEDDLSDEEVEDHINREDENLRSSIEDGLAEKERELERAERFDEDDPLAEDPD